MKQFHTGDPQILDTTAANVVLRATWRPRYLHPWSKSYFIHKELQICLPCPFDVVVITPIDLYITLYFGY